MVPSLLLSRNTKQSRKGIFPFSVDLLGKLYVGVLFSEMFVKGVNLVLVYGYRSEGVVKVA